MKESRKKTLKAILNVYIAIGVLLWIFAAAFILAPVVPSLAYRIYPQAKSNELQTLGGSIENDKQAFEETNVKEDEQPEEEKYIPDFDPNLPAENTIIIPSIGVNSAIQEGNDWEAALENGPWRVQDFATPTTTDYAPMILASHRFGIVGWNSTERTEKSFLNLPELQNGDTIEIIWEQRKYVYKVYSGEENTQITDYNADLILYTCKLLWESPVRIFRYAKLEEI